LDNLPETLNITPDWQGMFRFAIHLTEEGLSEGEGQLLVVEMLKYGQRLQEVHQSVADFLETERDDLNEVLNKGKKNNEQN
jgi:hypothetical protein